MRLQVLKGISGTTNPLYLLPDISKFFGSGTDTVQHFAEWCSARFCFFFNIHSWSPLIVLCPQRDSLCMHCPSLLSQSSVPISPFPPDLR